VRSARSECLDHLIVFGEANLRRVLSAYVTYYNRWRPHRWLSSSMRRGAGRSHMASTARSCRIKLRLSAAFYLAEVLLTQPLCVVVGDKVGAFGLARPALREPGVPCLRPQPAGRGHHSVEFSIPRCRIRQPLESGTTTEQGDPEAHRAAWLGTYQSHRRLHLEPTRPAPLVSFVHCGAHHHS
jgi:hypothetical protein